MHTDPPCCLYSSLREGGQFQPAGKIYLVIDQLDQPMQQNIFLYRTDWPSQERKPSQMYSVSPYLPQFQNKTCVGNFSPIMGAGTK
jgi:hypothetical protein